jgi:hypothetical protein
LLLLYAAYNGYVLKKTNLKTTYVKKTAGRKKNKTSPPNTSKTAISSRSAKLIHLQEADFTETAASSS